MISNGVENLVSGHHQIATSKSLGLSVRNLQPKTPGKILSKAPFVVPLRDENAPILIGARPGKAKEAENFVTIKKKNATFDIDAFITPMGPRNRAPLGIKTTNVKLNTSQTPSGSVTRKEPENTKIRATGTRRPKKNIHADATKLEVYASDIPLNELDVEYCPPAPKDLPYESDTFPDNCLDYSHIQPHNLMRDIIKNNCALSDENGLGKLEKEQEEAYQKDILIADKAARRMIDEDWVIKDIPETFSHQKKKLKIPQPVKGILTTQKKQSPPCQATQTHNSKELTHSLPRNSKLYVSHSKTSKYPPQAPITIFSRKKPFNTGISYNTSTSKNIYINTSNSKSTIGFSKGRRVHKKIEKQSQADNEADESDFLQPSTKSGPSKFHHGICHNQHSNDSSLLKLFEEDDGELEPGLRGLLPDCVKNGEEEDFFLTLS